MHMGIVYYIVYLRGTNMDSLIFARQMDPNAPPPFPDVNRGAGLVVAAWLMGVAGCTLLAMRMYVRSVIIKTIGWDDWTMVIATILAIVTNITVTLQVHYGVGRHAMYLTEENRVNAVYMIWLAVPFSPGSAAFGKVSIALLLMRLMNRNRFREALLWVLIFLLFAVNLVLIVITFAQCQPVTFLWERVRAQPPPGVCWEPTIQQNYGYFQGAFSAWSDAVLALFPIFIIWNVQVPMRVKLGICFLMSLGLVHRSATVAAAIKTVELKNLATPDFTWDAVPLCYWFLAENWIIIICACVPTLKPLFATDTWSRLTNIFSSLTTGKRSQSSSAYASSGKDKDYESKTTFGLKSLQRPVYERMEAASDQDPVTRPENMSRMGRHESMDSSNYDHNRKIIKTTEVSVV
ncbi:putative integral membrane protein [Paramyrothecium foliicola]|nr:putative integral membrane protein [Paramyrothecium foliicola]